MEGKGGKGGGTIVGYGDYVQRAVCTCMKIALCNNTYIFFKKKTTQYLMPPFLCLRHMSFIVKRA